MKICIMFGFIFKAKIIFSKSIWKNVSQYNVNYEETQLSVRFCSGISRCQSLVSNPGDWNTVQVDWVFTLRPEASTQNKPFSLSGTPCFGLVLKELSRVLVDVYYRMPGLLFCFRT